MCVIPPSTMPVYPLGAWGGHLGAWGLEAPRRARIIWTRPDFLVHVILPNIGKFYVQEIKIPIAHNPSRCVCRKRLVFVISSQLAINFRIKFSTDQVENPNPQITVNRSTISCLCHKPRFKVDLCLREIAAFVYNRLATKLLVQLPFPGIGVLIIKGETYRMLFDDRFATKIQETDYIKEIS
ncbi:hypothetical protein TNCV_647321 [Trichonephila clavipes]|uniref:CCDC81 HU domain-containing protein n=1 Tax=Trichonephila clavipes TaxID=2585209 RepID=A0A8X6SXH2_TRICX|nr:hypothetical protein TNCV_647321 [Trichonephila clavipes]